MPEWKTVKVKQDLLDMAEKIVDSGQYSSLSDFVAEAVRLHLDRLEGKEKTIEKKTEFPIIQQRLLYSPNHIWVMVAPDGNVVIGLSDFAQRRLTGIAHLETKPVGSEVRKQEPFGVVETWMFKFELHAPITGKILEINKALLSDPSIINKDPYESGWIAKIEPSNIVTLEEELRELMRPIQYKIWVSKMDQPRIPRT
ncbi:MAG: hypothetical protein ACQXXH_01000 [Candidatus Bathyarchaeia archaeon]|jgi:glycine cleavage system H protein|nr:hypothetical protein [Candidatus Bathyarchaeota archaeon A05DMB-4]MDH7595969.1 hypothetical protein [Candidatus Bathyarchaeota archaeon]